jgi:uncharacterized Tic20 family protein
MNEITPAEQQNIQPAEQARNKNENIWAAVCHISTFAGYYFPFANIIAPLVIWLVKKDECPFVRDQGKEAVNFQISITLYCIVCIPLVFICVGILLLIAIGIFDFICTIIATINASDGVKYRYPLCIRFIQ